MIFHSRHLSKIIDRRRNRGFIAIISVLIIAAVLQGVALTTSVALSLLAESITDSQNNIQIIFNSESCRQIESLRLATDPNYPGNETVVLPTGTCVTAPIN